MVSALKHLRFMRRPGLVARIAAGFVGCAVLGRDVLRSVELAVTMRCQLRCEKCYARGLGGEGREMTVPQIARLWEECRALGAFHVNLTGGEPLLREDVLDIVRALHPGSSLVSLVTNGEALDRHMARALAEAGLNTLQVSLDSHDPAVHDAGRAPGSFERAVGAIRLAHEAGLAVCASTVVTRQNAGDLPKLLDLAERLDALLLVNMASPHGGWEGRGDVLLTRRQFDEVNALCRRHPYARQDVSFNLRGRAGCPAGTEKLYITTSGDVLDCVFDQQRFGNVLEEPVAAVWGRMRRDPRFAARSPECLRYLRYFAEGGG